jgi:hypothetical protein
VSSSSSSPALASGFPGFRSASRFYDDILAPEPRERPAGIVGWQAPSTSMRSAKPVPRTKTAASSSSSSPAAGLRLLASPACPPHLASTTTSSRPKPRERPAGIAVDALPGAFGGERFLALNLHAIREA